MCVQLGIEFYLFVSHGGISDRGSTCKFRNARSAFRNLHVNPLSLHSSMRNKQVEFNSYIYTLSKLYRFQGGETTSSTVIAIVY